MDSFVRFKVFPTNEIVELPNPTEKREFLTLELSRKFMDSYGQHRYGAQVLLQVQVDRDKLNEICLVRRDEEKAEQKQEERLHGLLTELLSSLGVVFE